MSLKIAIVGHGLLTRDRAPFQDSEWDVWGLSYREFEFQRAYAMGRPFDVLWECHSYYWEPDYKLFMKNNKVRFPRENYESLAGMEGFKCSLSYMIAEAILLEPEEIVLYGIDCCVMKKQEYYDQIPNIKYFMGVATGRGIKVSAPEICELFETSNYGR